MIKRISLILFLLLCLFPLGVSASEVSELPEVVQRTQRYMNEGKEVSEPSPEPTPVILPEVSNNVPESVKDAEAALDEYTGNLSDISELLSVLIFVCAVTFGALLAIGFFFCFSR